MVITVSALWRITTSGDYKTGGTVISEFVRKTIVGYKTVTGRSDPECSHVILTLDEYEELNQRIQTAKNEEKKAKEDAERAAAKSAENAREAVMKVQTEAAMKIEKIQRLLQAEQSEKNYQIGLNQNLKRITRERANADRKIKPKKERSGYVVLSSRQKKYKYKEKQHDMAEVYLWETVIQTPYVVAFSAEQAMAETGELFEIDEQGQWLIGQLGIAGEYDGKYEDMLDDPRYTEWKDYNFIVEKIFNANGKAGYWEIIITHTKPLDNIGTELR